MGFTHVGKCLEVSGDSSLGGCFYATDANASYATTFSFMRLI